MITKGFIPSNGDLLESEERLQKLFLNRRCDSYNAKDKTKAQLEGTVNEESREDDTCK